VTSTARAEIEAEIRAAFEGVRLGDGISLRQAEQIDDYWRHITYADYLALPGSEVTDGLVRGCPRRDPARLLGSSTPIESPLRPAWPSSGNSPPSLPEPVSGTVRLA
jgi:hypothetical protein